MSKKIIEQKQLKSILSKEVASKNPIFSNEHISELYNLFSLYADPRHRRADIKDMLMTARTLGLDQRYDIVFRVLTEVAQCATENVSFEQFLKALTARIGNPFTEQGKGANFSLYDLQGKGQLSIDELKYINDQFRYGFSDEQLWEVIHSVGGFNAETITFQKFSKFITKRIANRKINA